MGFTFFNINGGGGGGGGMVTASNGLTVVGSDLQLGGILSKDTIVNTSNHRINFEGTDVSGNSVGLSLVPSDLYMTTLSTDGSSVMLDLNADGKVGFLNVFNGATSGTKSIQLNTVDDNNGIVIADTVAAIGLTGSDDYSVNTLKTPRAYVQMTALRKVLDSYSSVFTGSTINGISAATTILNALVPSGSPTGQHLFRVNFSINYFAGGANVTGVTSFSYVARNGNVVNFSESYEVGPAEAFAYQSFMISVKDNTSINFDVNTVIGGTVDCSCIIENLGFAQ